MFVLIFKPILTPVALLVEIKPDLASEVRMKQPRPPKQNRRKYPYRFISRYFTLFHVISLYFTLHTNVYLVVS